MLAVVAECGHADDPSGALRAYLAGMQRVLPRAHLPYQPQAGGVLALDDVWGPMETLDPFARQALVEGIAATVAHDNRITVAEAELLRTICGVLQCPLPPRRGRGGATSRWRDPASASTPANGRRWPCRSPTSFACWPRTT